MTEQDQQDQQDQQDRTDSAGDTGRRIEVEVEVPATPEQAWAAIATGPGISAWFMPAEVDGRVGGTITHRHDDELSGSGTITTYDQPRHFAYQEPIAELVGADEPGPPLTATEFLVEARHGGTCVVRVVMSGFGTGEQWDRAIESFAAGWRQVLVSLRLYLTHFAGQVAAPVNAGTVVPGMGIADHNGMSRRLAEALGLPPSPREGERVAVTAEHAPPFGGTVAAHTNGMTTMLLDTPAPGIGFVGAGGPGGDELFVIVRAQLFGRDAATVAEHQQRAWQEWIAHQFATTPA